MNKKIIVIAEITFALIFVVLLALFMSTITSKGNVANTNLINTLETTGGTSLQQYDNGQMKGEAVINAIRNVKTLGDDVKLELVVFNTKDTGGTAYGYVKGETTIKAYEKPDNNDDKLYINPAADYITKLVRNKNNVVIGIHFSQVNASGAAAHTCGTNCFKYHGTT